MKLRYLVVGIAVLLLCAPFVAVRAQGAAFYRAVDLAGAGGMTIDGNAWDADTASDFVTSGTTSGGGVGWYTLTPGTDTDRAAMIGTFDYGTTMQFTMSSVPNGSYSVYLYEVETYQPRTYSISVQGVVVQANFTSGSAYQWQKLGPYAATVTDGTLMVSTSGDVASLSGIEIWAGSATETPTPGPTLTPTNAFTPSPDVRVFITLPPSTPGNPGQGAEVDLKIDAGQVAIFTLLLIVIGLMTFIAFLLVRQGR